MSGKNLRNSWMFARYYAEQTLKNHGIAFGRNAIPTI